MKNHQRILHIRINQGSKFQLQETILIFLEQIHTRISLSTKYQLKLTILTFWIKFA